jgi:colanic acid/amylovoran biosynthesis protein
MNILITHVYSRYNKGDDAIVSVQIEQIRKIFPNSSIRILTTAKAQVSSDISVKCTNSFFYYCIYRNPHPIVRFVNTVFILGSTLVCAVIYKLFHIHVFPILPQDLQETYDSYVQANFITSVGGGYLNGKGSVQSYLSLIIHLHSIAISTLLGKHVILYSQSIGPFSDSIQKFLVKHVLNSVDGILVREDISRKTLIDIGVKQSLIYRTIDAGFMFTSNKDHVCRNTLPFPFGNTTRTIVGITVRKWLPEKQQQYFENEITSFASYLITERNSFVVFIPQVTSVLQHDDDRVVGNRIRMQIGASPYVMFYQNHFDSYEIKRMYEQCDYVIGTRMHSVIFALTGNIPCIAIEYEYKTRGIMRDLGLSPYVIKIEDVSSKKLIRLFNQLTRDTRKYKKHLSIVLKKYMKRSRVSEMLLLRIKKLLVN